MCLYFQHDLENDPAHPKGCFYKNLSHDQITYKKLNPEQMNHLREMDEVYATLASMKEIAEVVKSVSHWAANLSAPIEFYSCVAK